MLKPLDYTSHDVVAKVRRMLQIKRIGHTGTLDPQVTGVLPLCIGRATRIVEYIQDLPKEYEAELLIGIATDTEDLSGTIVNQVNNVKLNEQQIIEVIHSFTGVIEQVPPMYSALKVNGQKLVDLARRGVEIERQPRKVTIHHIEILELNCELDQPKVRFKVQCSKGTYIRTLCKDIGMALGYPAVMSHLVRTASGNIGIKQCLSLAAIEQLIAEDRLQHYLIATDDAIAHIPRITITDNQIDCALNGRKLKLSDVKVDGTDDNHLLRLYAQDDLFLGIYRLDYDSQEIIPVKVFR